MKKEESQKITALGVVIFSFISILVFLMIQLFFDLITAVLVLKTSLPEKTINLGSVIGTGAGLIVSAAFLSAKGRVKGIVAALIMAIGAIVIKLSGNLFMGLGGYLNWKGMIGILFVVLFSTVGAVLGAGIKGRK